jgi:hypothetical protein
MAPECQEKNAKGLTVVAIGMNKAADEFMILDERTRADLASGKYRDQRRGSFGTSASAPPKPPKPSGPAAQPAQPGTAAPREGGPRSGPSRRSGPARPARRQSPAPGPARVPWTRRQEKLALLYNEQGLRPAEIAQKLGVSSYLVTQIILATRNRGKL